MEREEIEEMIRTATRDGRIKCADAFRVADEAGVPVGMIGRIINDLKIKITGCQLGCF